LRALRGLWAYHTVNGRHAAALELAQRFDGLAAARPDPNDRLGGEAMIGVSQYFRGDLPSARRHLEHGLAGYVTPDQASHIIRFQTDQRTWTSVFLARVLWQQGFPDQAMRTARSAVEDARPANHAMSLCEALAHGACLALLTGDLTAVEHYGTMLLDHSTRQALTQWLACGRSLQGMLVIHRGDVVAGLRLLRAGFDEFGDARYPGFRLTALLMAEALGRAGQNDDGLAMIEEAIARAERTEEHWAMAELEPVKGELLLLQAGPERWRRLRITSGKHSIGRAGKLRCPGNCEPRRALPDCCAIRAVPRMRWRCSSRSTAGLPKASRPLILEPKRLGPRSFGIRSGDVDRIYIAEGTALG
jgi:Tetratricopeptide repeat